MRLLLNCSYVFRDGNGKRSSSVFGNASTHLERVCWHPAFEQLLSHIDIRRSRARGVPGHVDGPTRRPRHNHRCGVDVIVGDPSGSPVLRYVLHTAGIRSSVRRLQVEASLQHERGGFNGPY